MSDETFDRAQAEFDNRVERERLAADEEEKEFDRSCWACDIENDDN